MGGILQHLFFCACRGVVHMCRGGAVRLRRRPLSGPQRARWHSTLGPASRQEPGQTPKASRKRGPAGRKLGESRDHGHTPEGGARRPRGEPILAPGQCFQQPNPNTVARLGTACGPAGANRSEADLAMYQLACVSAVFSSFPTTVSLGMERSRPQTEPWRSGPRMYYSKYTRGSRRVCGTGVWSVPAT